jgi:hypothetical protein
MSPLSPTSAIACGMSAASSPMRPTGSRPTTRSVALAIAGSPRRNSSLRTSITSRTSSSRLSFDGLVPKSALLLTPHGVAPPELDQRSVGAPTDAPTSPAKRLKSDKGTTDSTPSTELSCWITRRNRDKLFAKSRRLWCKLRAEQLLFFADDHAVEPTNCISLLTCNVKESTTDVRVLLDFVMTQLRPPGVRVGVVPTTRRRRAIQHCIRDRGDQEGVVRCTSACVHACASAIVSCRRVGRCMRALHCAVVGTSRGLDTDVSAQDDGFSRCCSVARGTCRGTRAHNAQPL